MFRKCMPPRFTALIFFFLLAGGITKGFGSTPTPIINPRNVDASAFGRRIDVSSNWLFAPGDDPAYSSPAFDDSHWKVISTRDDLSRYGFRNLKFCWYRPHIRLPADARSVVLEVTRVHGRYRAFANGLLIRASGNMAKHAVLWQNSFTTIPIPDQALVAANGDLILAIRFSVVAVGDSGSGTDNPIGPTAGVFLASQDASHRDASYIVAHRNAVPLALCGLFLLVGLVSLALHFALPSQREYLVLAIYLLSGSAYAGCVLWENIHARTSSGMFFMDALAGVSNFTLIEFVRLVLRQPRTGILAVLEIASFFSPFMSLLEANGTIPYLLAFAGYFIPLLIIDGLLPLMLLLGWRRGNVDARLLLPAILMGSFDAYYSCVQELGYLMHLSRQAPRGLAFQAGGYQINLDDVSALAFVIAILLIVVLRTIRIARERARVASEIQAAQTMQQFLLARASQPTPGFEVESIYHPASELGGDFFFVSPGPDGSLTAIIGDVSGKGLLAAVRVSMILGVLRRGEARDPAAILCSLNQALLIQGETGFTTACCVRLDRDGFYTIANAGHLSPYIDGCEIETLPSLPLGLVAEQEYSSVSNFLPSGKKLVLLSDGVVEARSAKGELYGFDRLQHLTRMPAREIAQVAQRFGQEDDITVLTIAACA